MRASRQEGRNGGDGWSLWCIHVEMLRYRLPQFHRRLSLCQELRSTTTLVQCRSRVRDGVTFLWAQSTSNPRSPKLPHIFVLVELEPGAIELNWNSPSTAWLRYGKVQ